MRALSAEWNMRLTDEVCLTRSGPIARHDLLIRQGSYGERGAWNNRWSLAAHKPRVEYVEIRASGGTVLMRRFKSSVRVLSRLLHISPEGGIENFRFGWGTTIISNKPEYDAIDLLREMESHTNTVGKMSGEDLLPRMRQQLKAALADPALSPDAPAFKLIGAYFGALGQSLPDEDLEIVTGLARDDRVTRYENIWDLAKLPRPQQQAIRAAFVQRALATDDPAKLARSAADTFLLKMADGSYAALSAEEERLLLLPDRRWALPPFVARLYEGGARRVPLILDIIREHSLTLKRNIDDANARRIGSYEKSQENDGHRSMIEAARKSLCHLGPNAPGALEPLQEMMRTGVLPSQQLSGHQGESWNFVLARLGLPVDQLKKPASMSGSDESHRKRIQDKLSRDPKRMCDQ
jgi:hypothetical protein